MPDAAQGIRINAVCPGIIDAEMMRRFTRDTDGPYSHPAERRVQQPFTCGRHVNEDVYGAAPRADPAGES